MLDKIIQELVASFCSWSVDMGMMHTKQDDPRVTQSAPPTPRKRSSINRNINNNNADNADGGGNNPPSLDDPEYFQRVMQSRYPEHMLHCPQTSLYPIFFFLMERWEQRRAAASAIQQGVLPAPTPTPVDGTKGE